MKKNFFTLLLLFVSISTILFYSCSKNENATNENVTKENTTEEDNIENLETDPLYSNSSFENSSANPCYSCVSWVRYKIPSMNRKVGDLTTYTAKKKLINSSTANAGYAAIMPSSGKWAKYGHIAYVESVNTNGTITISEGNSSSAKCTTRTKTAADFKIDGYYKP